MEVLGRLRNSIMALLETWDDSLDLPFGLITFLSNRGRKFVDLSAYIKKHVKAASSHTQANGKNQKRHRELRMMCRLYECEPPGDVKI
jgi:hypothetical protein